ncbi:polyphosphate kinase 2 family protein [Consotaella aegiceratis]|uniref:polyphosphate kinase 2 family protein n=1 Tax=Consotaella aegiceratis TaxID=3097961 RepID=UPI002F416FDB
MNYSKKFLVKPGSKLHLPEIDSGFKDEHHSRDKAAAATAEQVERMARLQYLLYADGRRSLLVVLQALDAGGKDGTIRHLFGSMNPQGTVVVPFKQPSAVELAHDFLWRAHMRAPARGEVVIFNRSHYEDVLVVRVRNLAPAEVWSKRFDQINAFEKLLAENGTRILKFYLHISPDEQLHRFEKRLEEADKHWKISESDYSERQFWPQYIEAYEEAIERTSTEWAPWFVIPSDHKWFRNLAISHIIADAMDEMGMSLPPARVDIAAIRQMYENARRHPIELKGKKGD